MNFARAVVLGAVEGDQHPSAQPLERRQSVGGGNRLHGLEEQSIEGGRRGAVEHQADVVVGRDGRDPEKRFAIRTPMALGQHPLMRQKRWAAHEEQRKGRETDVRH